MKRPFESVRESFFENLDNLRENQRYNFSNFDKYMVWVVGFSIGGLSIIVSNLTSFNQLFSHCVIKIILVLLTTSIIAGLIYRLAFYMFQVEYQKIEFYLQGAFSEKEIMAIDPLDLSDENDINEIIRHLKIDFGIDVSGMLNIYNQVDDAGKSIILNDLKKHHQKTGEWAKADYDYAMNYAKSVFREAFGLSEKRIEKAFNSMSPKKLKIFNWTVNIAFLLSCFSFIAVIIILTSLY